MPELPLIDEPARDALRRATAALDVAERTARPHAMCQALAEVARCYLSLNATATAESYLEAALRWARFAGGNDIVVERLCELADAQSRLALEQDIARRGSGHASRECARDNAFEAATLAGAMADASCEAQWLMRISEVLEQCGDRDDAMQVQTRALRIMAECPRREAGQVSALGRLADA
jgi:tetratricopeptide (TPR) repeat protein